MKITCPECKQSFDSTKTQDKLIATVASNSGKMACIECPLCLSDFFLDLKLDPNDPSKAPTQGPPPEEEHPYRCPVSGCTGWVSYVEMKRRKPFWGCGECGAVWKEQGALFQGITAVIERYPYRGRSYKKDGHGGWLPGDPERELKTYEDKVEKEAIEYKED